MCCCSGWHFFLFFPKVNISVKEKKLRVVQFFGKKILVVFAPRLELGTSRVWGERHNQLDHANCQPPTRIELVTFSLRRRCSANWAIEALLIELCLLHTQKKIVAHSKKNCCTPKKKFDQISSKVLTLKTASGHQKKISTSGNRTRGVCVTGRNVTNYTNADSLQRGSNSRPCAY